MKCKFCSHNLSKHNQFGECCHTPKGGKSCGCVLFLREAQVASTGRKWSKSRIREMREKIRELQNVVEIYYQGQRGTIREMVSILRDNCSHRDVSFECDPSGNNDSCSSCNDCGKEF